MRKTKKNLKIFRKEFFWKETSIMCHALAMITFVRGEYVIIVRKSPHSNVT
jgi:hypothetical protein